MEDVDADADVWIVSMMVYHVLNTRWTCSISHAQHHNGMLYLCIFKALTIGYNLSVGPIFLLTEFNQHVSIIGILFAAGASCGTISAVSATLTKPGKWFFNKYLPVCACRICQPCVCACACLVC